MTAEIGHNHPPQTPFELSQAEAIDLFDEAKNWCDGEAITTAEQASALDDLLASIKEAVKRIEERRKEEARPYDEAKAVIQDNYNQLIGKNKSVTGVLVMAQESVLSVLTPWRVAEDNRKRAAAEEARKVEEAKLKAAQEAFEAARRSDDLAKREEAERLARDVQAAEREARRAEKAATTKAGLKTVLHVDVTDYTVFARWVWKNDYPAFEAWMGTRAAELARTRRDMEGVTVTETMEAR